MQSGKASGRPGMHACGRICVRVSLMCVWWCVRVGVCVCLSVSSLTLQEECPKGTKPEGGYHRKRGGLVSGLLGILFGGSSKGKYVELTW